MRLAVIVIALTMVGAAMAGCNSRRVRDEFEAFRRKYRKSYADEAEADYRCEIFAENFYKVETHNLQARSGLETYMIEINKFSDYTQEEFIRYYTGLKPELERRTPANSFQNVFKYNPAVKAPAAVDWRTNGFVTPIKDQGRCGSCYSFATTGVLESRYLIQNNKPYQWLDLSEQHFVDCSGAYGNQACNGGLMTNTYKYMQGEKHGAQKEADYLYESYNGNNGTSCKYADSKAPLRLTGYVEVDRSDSALEQAVAITPVAVGVKADLWPSYANGTFCPNSGGILQLNSCGIIGINHAVIVVGYTKDYWIIKNSWGEGWGEGGYMRLCRKYTNNCGINMIASYPNVV